MNFLKSDLKESKREFEEGGCRLEALFSYELIYWGDNTQELELQWKMLTIAT